VFSNDTITVPAAVRLQIDSAIVATGSVWKYLDNGSDQGNAWRASGFNDNAWKSGPAELGYGDAADNRPEATVVNSGPSSSKYITTYFRRAFLVPDPNLYTSLALGVLRDDGVVLYLNGDEIFRSNLPAGTIGYRTNASTSIGGNDETTFQQTTLNPALLRPDTNVLAAEIHQSSSTSTDISFDLFLHGTVGPSAPTLTIQDTDQTVTLTWPATASDYWLESAPDLAPGAWSSLAAPPQLIGNQIQLQPATVHPKQFFRLAR